MEGFITQYGEGGVSAIVVYAIIMLITSWWKNRRDKDRLKVDNARLEIDRVNTENQTIQILTTSVQISQQALQAQQQRIDQLETERDTSNKQRLAMQNEIDTLRDSVLKNKTDSERELASLRLSLKGAAEKIEDLERQLRAKDEQIRAQDQKIALLKDELEKSETDRASLQCEVEKLTLRVNGKADKPPSNTGVKPQTAEHAPEVSESQTKEESHGTE